MITGPEKLQIRQLVATPQWATAMRIAGLLTEKISRQSKAKPSEWETLKSVMGDEGQVQGIERFVKELNELAQDA